MKKTIVIYMAVAFVGTAGVSQANQQRLYLEQEQAEQVAGMVTPGMPMVAWVSHEADYEPTLFVMGGAEAALTYGGKSYQVRVAAREVARRSADGTWRETSPPWRELVLDLAYTYFPSSKGKTKRGRRFSNVASSMGLSAKIDHRSIFVPAASMRSARDVSAEVRARQNDPPATIVVREDPTIGAAKAEEPARRAGMLGSFDPEAPVVWNDPTRSPDWDDEPSKDGVENTPNDADLDAPVVWNDPSQGASGDPEEFAWFANGSPIEAIPVSPAEFAGISPWELGVMRATRAAEAAWNHIERSFFEDDDPSQESSGQTTTVWPKTEPEPLPRDGQGRLYIDDVLGR